MAMELFRQIVDQLAMAGPVDVRLFNFGEPLLHPEFPEMIRYGRNLGLSVNFQTNGLNLTEPTIRQLLAAGVSCFGISANGLNAEEYERIRPGYRFREFKENISSLRKIAEACGQAVTIHITAQILCDNRPALKQEIERYALEWTSIADSVSVSGLSPFEGISFLNNGALQEAHAGDLARRKETDVTCNEPFDRLVIKWDGRVTPCCVDFDATWVVGDANLQSIYEIWHSPRMEDLRAVVDRQVYRQNPLCRTCPKFYAKEFTLTFSKRKPEQRT
jgi:radical SAM protein with 4Fe4S-binding SPASM domain